MPEEERAPAVRNATWTALRTFRQRPTVVGQTDSGDTVYEIRSVRMILAPGSSHFKRLVECARCGRDMAGSSILALEDLDRQPNPVFCSRCVRASPAVTEGAAPPVVRPEPPAQEQPRPRPEAAPGAGPEVATLAAAVAELRAEIRTGSNGDAGSGMAALMEAQRRDLLASVAAGQRELRGDIAAFEQRAQNQAAANAKLVETQRRDLERVVHDRVQQAVASLDGPLKALADRQQAVEAKLAEPDVREQVAALERRMREQAAALGEQLRALEEARERTREALAVVTGPLQELTDRQDALEAKLAAPPPAGEQSELREEIAALDRRTREQAAAIESQLRALDDAVQDRSQETLAALAVEQPELHAEIVALEQRTRDQVAAIATQVDGQRREVEEALQDLMRQTLTAVAAPLQELTERQAALEASLSARIDEAPSADDLGMEIERLHTGMTALVDAQRQAATGGLDRVQADVASLGQAIERIQAGAARDALEAVSDPLRDLTRARQETERRLDALAASVEAGAARQRRLEQKLDECIDQVGRMLDGGLPAEAGAPRRAGGQILAALERQLRAAEERLAQR